MSKRVFKKYKFKEQDNKLHRNNMTTTKNYERKIKNKKEIIFFCPCVVRLKCHLQKKKKKSEVNFFLSLSYSVLKCQLKNVKDSTDMINY